MWVWKDRFPRQRRT